MKKAWFVPIIIFFLGSCSSDEVTPSESKSEIPQLIINEFMASNLQSFQDSENEGEFDDWIEIYNPGDKAINLGGLYFSDNKEYKTKFKIPVTDPIRTTIQPGGYLIFWADGELSQGANHLDFKLSADGEDIGIYTATGQIVNETSFGVQTTDVSAGRLPDASGKWATYTKPTPGAANTTK